LVRHHAWSCFLNDTPTTEIYTLSLHDALPISFRGLKILRPVDVDREAAGGIGPTPHVGLDLADPNGTERPVDGALAVLERSSERSEEHTSELQSRGHLVCRLLLEKKKSVKQRT